MKKHYQVQGNYFENEEVPYSYTIIYKDYYNGMSYSWHIVETFKNKDIAERVCDELNAKEVLNEKSIKRAI